MPPVFGPVSRSPMRLKSCAGASGTAPSGSPLHTHEQRELGPGEALLDHEGAPGVAERARRRGRLRTASRASASDSVTHDALARGEAVGLHDVEAGQRLEERERGGLVVGAERRVPRGRHAGGGQHLLHPRLRALEPGAGRGRARTRAGPVPAPRRRRRRRAGPRDRRPTRSTSRSSASCRDRGGVGRRRRRSTARARRSRVARARRSPRATPGDASQRPHRARARARPSRRRGHSRHRQAARRQHDGLGAVGADRPTKLTGHAHELLDEAHVVARLVGKVLDALGAGRSRTASRAASRRPAAPCAAPTGGTARGRSACRPHPRRRRTP